MSLQWNPWAAPAFLLFAGGTALAVLVYRNSPRRIQNRLLALALSSMAFAWLALGLSMSMGEGPDAYAVFIADPVFLVVHLAAYLGFLGTLPTPISRPLRTQAGRWALVGAALVGVAVILGRTGQLYPGVIDPVKVAPWARTGAIPAPWWSITWNLVKAAVFLFGVVVAVQYVWQTPPSTPSRSQAKVYLVAFGTRDVLFTVGVLIFGFAPVIRSWSWALLMWLSWWIGGAVGLTLITYGFLKYRLLGIDLTIKRGISRSTVAAVFVAVFFVVSEGAQVLFAEFAGNELLGIVAAGALVFFLAPLQRLGERVADTAMPGVENTEAYRKKRKREVYRTAVESAAKDEQITDAERDVLAGLQDELGLSGQEALELERDVLETSAGEA